MSNIKNLPFAFAKKHNIILLNLDSSAHIAYTENTKQQSILEVGRYFELPIKFNLKTEKEFDDLLLKSYQKKSEDAMQSIADIGGDVGVDLIDAIPKAVDLLDGSDEAPIIKLINVILTESVKRKASDIHIETFENYMSVRFRIDGVLHEVLKPQRELATLIISRIKVMSKMDIAEKRIPQDGRIAFVMGGKAIDVRVSSLPSAFSERIVMRLLDKQSLNLSIEKLGLPDYSKQKFLELLHKPYGIILVTGPTGSGKTTTLYSGLNILNEIERNILTIEDPIEYELAGIGQTQVNTKVDMTFAKGLRSILRQDPDVIMIGEIRDTETAEIAVQASLTGHLVLSTLHTNTAIGALSRLQNMGIETHLIASSLVGIIAQRLVRVLCPECKIKTQASSEDKISLEIKDLNKNIEIYTAKGCPSCNNIGYKGRIGLYEIVMIDKNIISMISNNEPEDIIQEKIKQFTPSMRQEGINAVLRGITTINEIDRVTTG